MSFSDVGTEWYSRCGRIGRLHVMSQLLGQKSKPEGFFPTFFFRSFFFWCSISAKKTTKLSFLGTLFGDIWLASGPSPSLMEGMTSSNSIVGRPTKKPALPVSYKAFADLLDLLDFFCQTESYYRYHSLRKVSLSFFFAMDSISGSVLGDLWWKVFFLMVKLPTLSAPSLLGSECHLIQSRSSDGRSLWRRRDAVMAPTSECHRAKASVTLRPVTILEVVPGHFYANLWAMRLLLDPWLCQMHLLARK